MGWLVVGCDVVLLAVGTSMLVDDWIGVGISDCRCKVGGTDDVGAATSGASCALVSIVGEKFGADGWLISC